MKKKLLLVIAVFAAASVIRADDKVDFAKSIKPIFENRCIECHGPKKVKGELRLDTKESALKGGESKKTIVPGDPEKSEMVRRISLPAGNDDIMPPKGDPLTKEQIEAIKNWMKEGANWPDGLTLGAVEKKDKPSEFEGLTPAKDTAAENDAIQKLAAIGISVRPIAQNLSWKEATVRPQDTNATSKAIELLKNVPSLVELNLAGLKIKDSDLANIANLKNLLRLHLENTPITDEGVKHLKGLTNLRYLNLYNTPITDESIDSLKGMTKLEKLYLWQTKITDTGAENLKKAVPGVIINRGEELKVLAKVEEKKDEKKEAKAEPKKEEKKDEAKKEEKKPEEKKDAKPAEKKEQAKAEHKKEEKKEPSENKAATAKNDDKKPAQTEEKKEQKKSDEKKPEEKKDTKADEKKEDKK